MLSPQNPQKLSYFFYFCVLVPLQLMLIHVLRNHKTESNPTVLFRKASVYRPFFTSRDKNNNSIILSANMKCETINANFFSTSCQVYKNTSDIISQTDVPFHLIHLVIDEHI